MRTRFFLVSMFALALAPPAAAQSTNTDSVIVAAHNGYNQARLDSIAATITRYCRTNKPLSYVCLRTPRQVADVLASDRKLAEAFKSSPPPPPPPPPPAVVPHMTTISGVPASLKVGSTAQLSAVVQDFNGAPIPGAVAVFTASPTSIATVTSSGLVRGVAKGTVTISAGPSSTPDAVRSVQLAISDTAITPPPPPPPPPPAGGNVTLAQLPLATVDITLPIGYQTIDVPAGASLQAALDASGCRVNLRLAADASYGAIQLRQKPCNEKYHTLFTTNNGLPLLPSGVRVTQTISAQRRQGKIVTTGGNIPAVAAGPRAGGYYFEDVAILGQGSTLNAIVYLGQAQTTLAEVPTNFVLRHTLISGTPTLDVKRCLYLNSGSTAFVDGSGYECHSNNGDSQCALGLNGPGPFLIDNVYCEAGHEVIMFGGGDPSIPGLVPSDITIRHSHITRPASWKGVWQVKNLIESKNARRMLIEGNVIENNWADGQTGYGLLLKSVNQDGTAPWSTSQDITVRDNLIRNVGAGVNLCAACQGQVVPMTRVTIYNNVIVGINQGQYTGEARIWQFLNALTNVAITHNTATRSNVEGTSISLSGQPPKITTFDFRSNVYDLGPFGIHGDGTGGTVTLLTSFDTSSTRWTHNLSIGTDCQSAPWMIQRCASSAAAAGLDTLGVLSASSAFALPSHDGAPIGADAARVYALTAGVVVADPARGVARRGARAGARAVATARQTGYRATSDSARKADANGGGSSVR